MVWQWLSPSVQILFWARSRASSVQVVCNWLSAESSREFNLLHALWCTKATLCAAIGAWRSLANLSPAITADVPCACRRGHVALDQRKCSSDHFSVNKTHWHSEISCDGRESILKEKFQEKKSNYSGNHWWSWEPGLVLVSKTHLNSVSRVQRNYVLTVAVESGQ